MSLHSKNPFGTEQLFHRFPDIYFLQGKTFVIFLRYVLLFSKVVEKSHLSKDMYIRSGINLQIKCIRLQTC